MTMAASVEARLPFLDQDLVACAASLPENCRVRGRTTKWILRQAMADCLPAEILQRPKVGFRMPVNEWIRGSLRGFVIDSLAGPCSRSRDFYAAEALRHTIDDHMSGRQNHEKLIMTMLSFEIFMRECL